MERILNTIGIGLLAVCFVVSLSRIVMLRMGSRDESGEKIVDIRLAHWQLEGGVRASIDAMAEEYMKLHPNVRITQIAIPERIYRNWQITQLVGGTAPDIVQIGMGINEERLARFFVPLTELAQKANPYNKGTDLEGIILRDTFLDGMLGGFNPGLLEYYGVPIALFSIRLFVNLDLLKAVTGSAEPPKTFEELMEVCRQAKEYGKKTGTPLIPIAGSRYNSPLLMDILFSSQTQRLLQELGPPGSVVSSPTESVRAQVEGKWSLDSEQIRDGLQLMREVADQMQPGFMQVTRDDASFYFVQGRALMIATGSWDATSVSQQANFPFTAVRIPLPTAAHPEYGENVLGPFSEAGRDAGLSFGLTRSSKHPEVAADFLLFLASRQANQIFTNVSKWLPSVVGVEPAPEARPFMSENDGFPQGFPLVDRARADANRLVQNNFHLLIGPEGSEERFVEAIRPSILSQLLGDLRRGQRATIDAIRRMDVQVAALEQFAAADPGNPGRAAKLDMSISALMDRDRKVYYDEFVLKETEERVKKGSE